MIPELKIGLIVAGCFMLMLGAIAWAAPKVGQNATRIVITRRNGQEVTHEQGRVVAWSFQSGEMRVEYEPDIIYRNGFQP